jgi:hypothetical protein
MSLSAQVVSAFSYAELERQRLYLSVSLLAQSSALVPVIMIQDNFQKVNESKIGYSSK